MKFEQIGRDVKNAPEKKAYNLMKIIHSFQRRLSGEMYSEHPKGVVDIILKDWQDREEFEKINSEFAEKIAVVGYLHDSLEDTKLDKERIKEIFSDEYLNILEALTENKELREKLEKEAKEKGYQKIWMKEKMLEDSLRKIRELKEVDEEGWRIAATVRIADIIQNMKDFEKDTQDEDKKKRQERFLKKAKRIVDEFDGEIDLVEKLKERIKVLV